jgi:lysine 2,3-aminomutase
MKTFQAYQHRAECFREVAEAQWKNWIWQQQNAVRNSFGLRRIFPAIGDDVLKMAVEWEKRGFRFLITPYVAALVRKDGAGNPLPGDQVWGQVFPQFEPARAGGCDEYSPNNDNWEIAEEMISPIAMHKYDNRVLVMTGDACLGYCVYCFRSLQSEAREEKHGGMPFWKETIEAIRARPGVEEVILSGGEPLIFDNAKIEEMLKDLRGIAHVKAIRIHTRAWLHNPFRIDKPFCELLKKYDVTEMGVHTIHPAEITRDFLEAVERIRESGARTLLMCDTPLIKGINDSAEILHELFMELYTCGVKPYYLSHNMPNIPFAAQQRTSVKKGLRLLNSLKRRVSNPALPEYIITARSGKKTVPECEEGTPDFVYEQDQNGWPVIRFKNWKGEWSTYPDAPD